MITLKKANIHKFKCVETDQTFSVDPDITVLVGMNESGKTSVLQALAKTKYFSGDSAFKFSTTHDYPRKEKKRMDRSGKTPKAVTCEYALSHELLAEVAEELGDGVFTSETVSTTVLYNNITRWGSLNVDINAFITAQLESRNIASKTLTDKLLAVHTENELQDVIDGYQDESIKSGLAELKKYYVNKWDWSNDPVGEYLARVLLTSHMPKFLYYDEYYALPSRISIEDLQNEELEGEELKTAKALFELADINISEVINSDEFEDFKAELEATEATITEELFEYWTTNTNLEIRFDIDKVEKDHPSQGTRIVEHILDIRVRNNRTKMSLPLRNRSKGFNWFFSFLVWFKRIQEDTASNYVLLLDEPGLNLHAAAQADLLRFIEVLADNYQIVYTTHSPFMVDPQKLHRVRTVVETDAGTVISDSIQEQDPNTLFPLQAALGYDIAQNLFITKCNLIVEGVSDLIFLQAASGALAEQGRTGLRNDITIVPVGGLEKVSTFVSLLRGNSLNMVCLVDSSMDRASRAQLDNLIASKIIKRSKVLTYDQFVEDAKEADIEDMFEVDEYLGFFNAAFNEHEDLSPSDLNKDIPRIVQQLNKVLGVKRFNHYRPARQAVQDGSSFSETALTRFESAFAKVNDLI